MKIEIGEYTVYSDAYSMWIMKNYRRKNKKGEEKIQAVRVAGYSSDWEDLLDSFLEHAYRGSDATTVRELLKDMEKAEKDIKKFIKEGVNHE